MSNIIIREITKADNEAIAKVIREIFDELNIPKVGTAYEDKALSCMYETYLADKSSYYVIEDNGEVIGGAGIAPLENFEGNICELQKMYFLSKARGKGLGFKMMQTCLDKAREFGFAQCYLETMPYMTSARKLYSKVGFEDLNEPMGCTGHYSCSNWMIKTL